MSLANNNNHEQENEQAEPDLETEERSKQEIKLYLKQGRMYFKLFSEIVKLDVKFIENEQWIKKVTNVVNYYANKMSSK